MYLVTAEKVYCISFLLLILDSNMMIWVRKRGAHGERFNYSNSIYGGYIYIEDNWTKMCAVTESVYVMFAPCICAHAWIYPQSCPRPFACSVRIWHCHAGIVAVFWRQGSISFIAALINGWIIVKAIVVMSIINRATDEEKMAFTVIAHRATPAKVWTCGCSRRFKDLHCTSSSEITTVRHVGGWRLGLL